MVTDGWYIQALALEQELDIISVALFIFGLQRILKGVGRQSNLIHGQYLTSGVTEHPFQNVGHAHSAGIDNSGVFEHF